MERRQCSNFLFSSQVNIRELVKYLALLLPVLSFSTFVFYNAFDRPIALCTGYLKLLFLLIHCGSERVCERLGVDLFDLYGKKVNSSTLR